MKNIVYIFSCLLFLLSTAEVFACENFSDRVAKEQSSCKHIDKDSEKKSCCDTNSEDDDECNGSCSSAMCHCPSTVNTTVAIDKYQLQNTVITTLLNTNNAYNEHSPKAVYLSIWLPPKIS